MRIRVLKHDLEVNLLLAVRTGLLLANNAPSADAKLVKAGDTQSRHNTTLLDEMFPHTTALAWVAPVPG